MSHPQYFEHRRPLLPGTDYSESDDAFDIPTRKSASSWGSIVLSIILVVSISLNLLQFATRDSGTHCQIEKYSRPEETYSHGVVEYELRKFSRAQHISPYHGPPSDTVDEAWEDLYSFGVSKIPQSQAALLINKTVEIPGEDSQYVVALDVFHQLHCLNMVRQALHPDYYPPVDVENGFDHNDHCINSLRESLMCSVDITPNVWIWDESRHQSMPRLDNIHTCRNFDKLRDWARRHHLDKFNPNLQAKGDTAELVI